MPIAQILQPLHSIFMIASFVLGCVVGSFCNVCICRWPMGESVIRPRSRCPKCLNSIAWYDNIPLVSWLALGAKCRHCGQPISWKYPLVEAITGALFMAVFWRFGFDVATPIYMALCAALVIVTFQDLADWTIPNEITLPGILAGIGVSLLAMTQQESMLRVADPIDSLDGIAAGCFIICLMDSVVVLLLRKPGMGFGDVKLLAMLGAFLGWRGVIGTLLIGSLVGSVVGVAMILYFRSRQDADTTEPSDQPTNLQDAPIDPVAAVALGACTVYLAARCFYYLLSDDMLPPELRPILTITAGVVTAFAMIVSGLSLSLYARQQKSAPAKHGSRIAEHLEGGAQEEDLEITLQGHYLPFGPYLAAGGILFLFFGPELYQWYTVTL
ncbi:MAG TPA: prepilin peptidase [Candidatus Hydrogenedentes bacterium]|nr:prepilin peptidase [Candidatus Hydrogenedentota bacterium]